MIEKAVKHGVNLLVGAVVSIEIQVWALVCLDPASFGVFSILVLSVALVTSVTYSVICEPWQISGGIDDWKIYGSVLTLHTLFVMFISALVAFFVIHEPLKIMLVCLIIGFTIYRFGCRYYSVHKNEQFRILVPDLVFFFVATSGIILTLFGAVEPNLEHILICWALAITVSAIISKPIELQFISSIKFWFDKHNKAIKPLLVDSSLLDFVGIGIPLLLVPILGIQNFGTYRGISNLTSPVKLVLSGVRPYLGRLPLYKVIAAKGAITVLGIGLVPALIVYSLLNYIQWSATEIGTLSSLTTYSLQISLVTLFTFANGVYYLLGRLYLGGKKLIVARTMNVFFGVVFPIFGAICWGLQGAVNLFTLANLFFVIIWYNFLKNENLSSSVFKDIK